MIVISSNGKIAIDSTGMLFEIYEKYIVTRHSTDLSKGSIVLTEYRSEEQAQLAFDFLLTAFKNEKPTYRLMKADCCASEVEE